MLCLVLILGKVNFGPQAGSTLDIFVVPALRQVCKTGRKPDFRRGHLMARAEVAIGAVTTSCQFEIQETFFSEGESY